MNKTKIVFAMGAMASIISYGLLREDLVQAAASYAGPVQAVSVVSNPPIAYDPTKNQDLTVLSQMADGGLPGDAGGITVLANTRYRIRCTVASCLSVGTSKARVCTAANAGLTIDTNAPEYKAFGTAANVTAVTEVAEAVAGTCHFTVEM